MSVVLNEELSKAHYVNQALDKRGITVDRSDAESRGML
jgi:hypothetical protein